MDDQVNVDQQTQTTQAAAPEPEPTLDDVYRSAGITSDTPTQQTQQAPTQQTQQPTETQIDIPDPFVDTEGFRRTIAQQHQGLAQTTQAVQAIAQFIQAERAKQAQAVVQKDIADAVGAVNEVVNHPKPKVVEAMLHAKAMEDPKFQALWNNRHKNKDAWNSALKVVAKEFQRELDVKADAGLVEAQRARRVAQGQMATTAQERSDDSWDGLAQADFDARWQAMLGS